MNSDETLQSWVEFEEGLSSIASLPHNLKWLKKICFRLLSSMYFVQDQIWPCQIWIPSGRGSQIIALECQETAKQGKFTKLGFTLAPSYVVIWPYMVHIWSIYAHIWPYIVHICSIYEHIWPIYDPYMTIYGTYMGIYDHIWAIYGTYMAIYEPYMATYGPYMAIYVRSIVWFIAGLIAGLLGLT